MIGRRELLQAATGIGAWLGVRRPTPVHPVNFKYGDVPNYTVLDRLIRFVDIEGFAKIEGVDLDLRVGVPTEWFEEAWNEARSPMWYADGPVRPPPYSDLWCYGVRFVPYSYTEAPWVVAMRRNEYARYSLDDPKYSR